MGVHARINGPGIIEIENCEKEGSTSTEITKEDVLDIPDCVNIRRHSDTKSYESIRKHTKANLFYLSKFQKVTFEGLYTVVKVKLMINVPM